MFLNNAVGLHSRQIVFFRDFNYRHAVLAERSDLLVSFRMSIRYRRDAVLLAESVDGLTGHAV